MICPKISIGIKFSLGLKKDFCFLWLSYLPFILVPSPSCPSPSPNLGEAHLDNMHWFQYVTEFGVNLLYNTHFHIKNGTLFPRALFSSPGAFSISEKNLGLTVQAYLVKILIFEN